MGQNLKMLLENLGEAINSSIAESERILEALGEMEKAGYDVLLGIEVTIALTKTGEDEIKPKETGDRGEGQLFNRQVLNETDQKFLRALRIKPE